MRTRAASGLISLGVVLCCALGTLGSLYLPGAPLHQFVGVSLGATDIADPCGGASRTCRDCSTAMSCLRFGDTFTPGPTTTCSGATPFCVSGACAGRLTDNGTACARAVASSSFTCQDDGVYGYYPDPSDCTRYHFCDAQRSAFDLSCAAYAGTAYSHASAACEPRAQAQCAPFTCSAALVGVYQTYRPDPSVYLVCTDASLANARMAKCPDNYEIDASDLSAVVCRLRCLRAGRFPVSGDSTRYYECVSLSGTTFSEPIPAVCPGNSTFSAAQERCVIG